MSNEPRDMNRDPISGAPGAHPIGTGLGATGGAMAGAAIGSVGGPIGSVVGGAIGAVVGGLGGKAAGEAVNPTAENAYWQSTYENEPYRKAEFGYGTRPPVRRSALWPQDRSRGRTVRRSGSRISARSAP